MSYNLVSLFSGAGFLDIGFVESGFSILKGYELNSEFARAHNHNFSRRYNDEKLVEVIDITKVPAKSLPLCEGIIGGPPCQDFSAGNSNNTGVEGERGKLVWDFLKKIKYRRPNFFVFENVATLYTRKKHRTQALEPLLKEFDKLGYQTYFKVLNSLHYGIPQDRSRVFIVAFKKKIIKKLEKNGLQVFTWPEEQFNNPKKAFDWSKVHPFGSSLEEERIIEELGDFYPLTVHSRIYNNFDGTTLKNNVSFNPKSSKFQIISEGDDRRKSFKRLHRFRYSPTVAYGNNEVHLHPTLPRRLTVREALRLQSVPDWYYFPEDMTLQSMFKMVSNGVPVELSIKLAVQVKKVLDDYYGIIEPE
ncbi:DNA cytosine methyltransferase [Mesobacillus sp. AQ2]|uniref:DNA cytosine methyltransferase n=1 Tax=Mesobacillus sp. AQ2 TaxID=3043332 RepID=UPI0024C1867A|nr:DNA cytosine methyltransferase [Mesobacillus sp. AQ2]WHX42659.1 DNA cytosine methyltransferase [Mesobacillus sp. AQ2]